MTDLATPDHQNNQEAKGEQGEERLLAIDPTNSHCRNPGLDVKVDRQAHEQAHRIKQQRSLDRVRTETLADVVHSSRDANKRANRHEKLSDGHHGPVKAVLHCRAYEAQA